MLVLTPHEKLAPQSHDLPAFLMPIPHPHPKLFRFSCMSSSHSWGACPVAQGRLASSESPAQPHPQHTCFLAPPDALLPGAKNQPKQPELHSERPALCPQGSGEGAFRFPLSRPSP